MPDFCQPLVTRLEGSGWLPHAIDQLTVNEPLGGWGFHGFPMDSIKKGGQIGIELI